MEEATFVISIILGIFIAGAAVGYQLRNFIGKEIVQIGADIRTEIAKAKVGVNTIAGKVKSEL